MGCNCGGKKAGNGVGQKIPPKAKPPQAPQESGTPDRKARGRRYAVVGGDERRTFVSLGEARRFQRERGGRVR